MTVGLVALSFSGTTEGRASTLARGGACSVVTASHGWIAAPTRGGGGGSNLPTGSEGRWAQASEVTFYTDEICVGHLTPTRGLFPSQDGRTMGV
jgi:hypothetical protein